MKTQEVQDKLNKLSPDGLQDWMTDRFQIRIQATTLAVPVAIDISELDKLSDDKIKELIHGRMISSLIDRLNTLTGVTV